MAHKEYISDRETDKNAKEHTDIISHGDEHYEVSKSNVHSGTANDDFRLVRYR